MASKASAPKAAPAAPKAAAPKAAPITVKSAPAAVKSVEAKAAPLLAAAAKSSNPAAKALAAAITSEEKQLNTFVSQLSTAGSTSGGSPDSHFTQGGYSGTSNTGQNYVNGQPVSPAEFNSFLNQGSSGGSANVTASSPDKQAISTTSSVDASGNQIQTITFSDGTTTTNNLGLSADTVSSRQNVFDSVKSLFESYGVLKKDASGNYDATSKALADTIQQLATSGAGADTISLQLQQSDAYKQRFAGNEARKAAGLNVLSPAEYIATENAYQSVLRAAGVPADFYSGTTETAKLIGADVSATELQSRVDLAAKSINNSDPFYTSQLQSLYGLSSGDMIAHVLDPTIAMPLIQKQVSSSTVAAEAARQGTNVGLSTAEQLAGMGVTQAQAASGFGSIAAQLPATQSLAARYQGYGQASEVGSNLQAATFGTTIAGETPAEAEARLKRLQTQEVSAFGGSAGASTQGQSLGIGNAQGVS
jgi:hypothetical protein